MDHKLTLTVAIANVNTTLEVLKDNPSFDIISANLNSVKLILENQSQKLESTVDITEDYTDPKKPNPFKRPEVERVVNSSKVNTYCIEELVTTGWTVVDPKTTTNLTKDRAREIIKNLVDHDSYNPASLRVSVDGQV
tara:strand:+ start:217 stop:627 length:411 start_codon:yes stop_codon:yes gene_type:complete